MTSSYFNLLVKGTGIEVVSTHTCKYCGDEYALYDVEQKLYDEQGMRYSEVCSVCIFRMLYSYINDRHLYHRLDFRTGKKIVSVISEAYTESEVLDAVEYNQLATDDMGLEYGQQLGEDSFGQFKKLYRSFPKYARMIYDCPENSLYSSHVGWSKNLYLSFCVFEECENIYYSFRILGNAKRIFSSIDVSESSDVYLSRMVANAHDVAYSSNISESNAVFWSKNLQNCHHCAFCCNLVGASYKIFNTQYTKEEYETAYEDILNRLQDPGQFHLLQKRYEEFLSEHLIEPALNIQNSEQVVGDNIYFSSKNINSFRGFGNYETVNTILTGNHNEDKQVRLINSIESGQMCENTIGSCSFGEGIFNVFFGHVMGDCQNVYYSADLQFCHDCMFCVGLRNKSYCILNTQYEKDTYFEMKQKIITRMQIDGTWGEFLGFDFSSFPYNDTSAYDFFKVQRVIYADGREEMIDANAKGVVRVETDAFISPATLDLGGEEKISITWRTKTKEVNVPEGVHMIQAQDMPSIEQAGAELLESAIICEKTGRPFRIIADELAFLQKKKFPLPRVHHEYRIDRLLAERPLGQLHIMVCDACGEECMSVYREKPLCKGIYCPECYKNYMFN